MGPGQQGGVPGGAVRTHPLVVGEPARSVSFDPGHETRGVCRGPDGGLLERRGVGGDA